MTCSCTALRYRKMRDFTNEMDSLHREQVVCHAQRQRSACRSVIAAPLDRAINAHDLQKIPVVNAEAVCSRRALGAAP
jgi:hypothetical protein